MMSIPSLLRASCVCAVLVLAAAGCETNFAGSAFENEPPDTQLSVRDTSLVDNIGEAERLPSSVLAAWTGSDPDGYVVAFEVRQFSQDARPAPEEGWTRTARNDSLMLLPIPRGERTADVVLEVRAIDNEGLTDATPARTIFPIQNAPPTIRLSNFDLPPDTTFHVFSFGWIADDPEGPENLDHIQVSFNDTTRFVALPSDAEFVTFVGQVDRGDPSQQVADAEVYVGRAFQNTGLTIPGLRLDAENTIYVRAVDQTDTTSALVDYSWHVKRSGGRVLLVNDYRKSTSPVVLRYHHDLLREYLPASEGIDVWDLTTPYVSGSAGNVPRSDLLPPNADPTLRRMFAEWDYVYWISTNTVNSIGGNNLPFTAGALDVFFEEGGKMMVHTPVTQPQNPEDNLGNPAILLLPLSDLLVRPDSLQRLELGRNAPVDAVGPLPGVSEPLPDLKSSNFFINELPFYTQGANIIPLYDAAFGYLTRRNRRGTWPGPRTVASISADQRVGLFALPLVNEVTGAPLLVGADDDPEAPRRAVMLMLESLGFPRR